MNSNITFQAWTEEFERNASKSRPSEETPADFSGAEHFYGTFENVKITCDDDILNGQMHGSTSYSLWVSDHFFYFASGKVDSDTKNNLIKIDLRGICAIEQSLNSSDVRMLKLIVSKQSSDGDVSDSHHDYLEMSIEAGVADGSATVVKIYEAMEAADRLFSDRSAALARASMSSALERASDFEKGHTVYAPRLGETMNFNTSDTDEEQLSASEEDGRYDDAAA